MDDNDLLRYSRHILLPEVDLAGQEKLTTSHVAIIGLGGLGSPVALYLAASGITRLTLVDHDRVDLGNLQRQIAHTESRIGEPKVHSAALAIAGINSDTLVKAVDQKLSADELLRMARDVDLIVDCTDNFESRRLINRACVATKTPLVSGAAIRLEGQLMVFDPTIEDSPCYQCLYGDDLQTEADCATTGVIAPIVGVFGSLMALEALKVILGIAKDHTGCLTTLDGLSNRWHNFSFKKRPDCPACSS